MNLRILMGREFEGCEWEDMGPGFWEPLRWLGGNVVEQGLWNFEEVGEEKKEEGKGWWDWMGGWFGTGIKGDVS